MISKVLFILMMPFISCITLCAQDVELINQKLRFFAGDSEFASLDYQFNAFGPVLELISNHYLGTIRLTSGLDIEFRTGYSSVSQVEIDNQGYTKLGSDAPGVKIKVITGTSSNLNSGATQIPHGLGNSDRILGVSVHMNFFPGSDNPTWYPPGIAFDNHNYTYFYDKFNVTVQNNASSGTTLQNKPIKVLVYYTK